MTNNTIPLTVIKAPTPEPRLTNTDAVVLSTETQGEITIYGGRLRWDTDNVKVAERDLTDVERYLVTALLNVSADTIRREPGEPVFVLQGRDPQAPNLVLKWAHQRELMQEDSPKVASAREIAMNMVEWKKANPHIGMPTETYQHYLNKVL